MHRTQSRGDGNIVLLIATTRLRSVHFENNAVLNLHELSESIAVQLGSYFIAGIVSIRAL